MQQYESPHVDVTLEEKHALLPEFYPPLDKAYGERDPDLEERGVRLRIGNLPVGADLWELYELSGKTPISHDKYGYGLIHDIWLVRMNLGVMDEGNAGRLREVGITIRFTGTEKPRIIDLLPDNEFELHNIASIWGTISLNGEASVSAAIPEIQLPDANIGGSASAEVKGEGQVAIQKIITSRAARILASGRGSNVAEWRIVSSPGRDLRGDQELALTLQVPHSAGGELPFEARLSATVSRWGFPSYRKTDWLEGLVCQRVQAKEFIAGRFLDKTTFNEAP